MKIIKVFDMHDMSKEMLHTFCEAVVYNQGHYFLYDTHRWHIKPSRNKDVAAINKWLIANGAFKNEVVLLAWWSI